MADGYDRFDNEGGGGGSFVMGLLTGTVLGAGLGMLFAPKAGSELRSQVAEQAGNLANTASEGYRRASEAAGSFAEKGRDAYDKARDAVSRGAEEAQRYVREATGKHRDDVAPNQRRIDSRQANPLRRGRPPTSQPGSGTPGGSSRRADAGPRRGRVDRRRDRASPELRQPSSSSGARRIRVANATQAWLSGRASPPTWPPKPGRRGLNRDGRRAIMSR